MFRKYEGDMNKKDSIQHLTYIIGVLKSIDIPGYELKEAAACLQFLENWLRILKEKETKK